MVEELVGQSESPKGQPVRLGGQQKGLKASEGLGGQPEDLGGLPEGLEVSQSVWKASQ